MASDRIPAEQFGSVALSLGMITQEQLDECRKIKDLMEEMGIQESISHILVKKGYLNTTQVNQILRTMGVQVQPIPGYQILGRLGAGGMGAVYKAKQLAMGRIVAIKVLAPHVAKEKDFIGRFFREAQAAAKLNHKNIIQAFDAGAAGNLYYFVMEYVEGTSVKRRLERQGRLAEKEALRITLQIAEALDYISEHGMVHRDVKPENIMVTPSGMAKLCDFGLARSTQVDSSITRAGLTFGTPHYMSPEQIQGDRTLDIRADLYSLGASLFHMLTGHPPFEGSDLREILSRHLTLPPPKACDVVSSVSERTSRVIQKLMAKDREDRYRTPRDLVEDLRSILRGLEPKHAKRVTMRRNARRPALTLLAAGALGVLLLGAAGAFITGLASPEDRVSSEPKIVSKPAPPPVAGSPEPSPGAASGKEPPVDRREMEAEKVLARADAVFEQGNWSGAGRIYERLIRDFSDTACVQERRDHLRRRMAAVREKLNAVARAREREEELERLREQYRLGHKLVVERRWAEAEKVFESLLEHPLPPEVVPAEITRMIELCRNEIEAGRAWTEIVKAREAHQWSVLARACDVFTRKYKETKTYSSHELDLSSLRVRLEKEISAQAQLQAARDAVGRGAWEEAAKKLDEGATRFAETDVWKAASGDIASMREAIRQGKARPLEEKALATWNEAEAAFEKGAWSEAKAAFERLLSGELAASALASARKTRIEERLKKIDEALAKARENEARVRFIEARDQMIKHNWEEALKILKNLDSEFAGTRFVRRKASDIARYMEQIERVLRLAEFEVVDDFEGKELSGWRDRDPARFERQELDPPRGESKAALRFRIGKLGEKEHIRRQRRGTWPAVLKEVEGRIPDETVAITFWIRLGRGNFRTNVWFTVEVGTGDSRVVLGTEVQDVSREWKFVEIPLSRLRGLWGHGTRRIKPSDIRAVGFGHYNPFREMEYIVDDIRLKYR